jgi:hypothetical protein
MNAHGHFHVLLARRWELDSAEDDRLQAHLAVCADCRATAVDYETQDRILPALGSAQPEPALRDRILYFAATPELAKTRGRRPMMVLALLALVLAFPVAKAASWAYAAYINPSGTQAQCEYKLKIDPVPGLLFQLADEEVFFAQRPHSLAAENYFQYAADLVPRRARDDLRMGHRVGGAYATTSAGQKLTRLLDESAHDIILAASSLHYHHYSLGLQQAHRAANRIQQVFEPRVDRLCGGN